VAFALAAQWAIQAIQQWQAARRAATMTGTLAAPAVAPAPAQSQPAVSFGSVTSVSKDEALVSVKHNASVTYGTTPPYDPASNPAYQFIWDTVAALQLGPLQNPLDELIDSGDTVLIKPNLTTGTWPDFTHPATVRPLIDMAIAAGATSIWIGDSSLTYNDTASYFTSTGYAAMVAAL
jgi:hypothetical protein